MEGASEEDEGLDEDPGELHMQPKDPHKQTPKAQPKLYGNISIGNWKRNWKTKLIEEENEIRLK